MAKPWGVSANVKQKKPRKPWRPKPKPRRGTMERVAFELAHAAKMADASKTKLLRAVSALSYWNRRERYLAAKLQAGPQPPRPPRPKPVTRGIRLPKATALPLHCGACGVVYPPDRVHVCGA